MINVKDKGAKGDGQTDDTAAIQMAIDESWGTGGTVLVPKGTYMVDAVGKKRLTLKSEMMLKLSAASIERVRAFKRQPDPAIGTKLGQLQQAHARPMRAEDLHLRRKRPAGQAH